MASAPMPTPPDVRAQGQPDAGAGGDGTPAIMKAQDGQPQGPTQQDETQNLTKAMDTFEKATGDLYAVVKDKDPQAEALFPQIIEWGRALKDRITQLAQKAKQGVSTPAAAQPATNPAEAPPGPVAAGAAPAGA